MIPHMVSHITMFKKLYKKKNKLLEHFDAPLLHERETYISHMEEKGYSLKYQRKKASYLLYAVRSLSLIDGEYVTLESIVALGDSYKKNKINQEKTRGKIVTKNTKDNDLVCTVVDFFTSISLIDPRIIDQSNLVNSIFKFTNTRLKYFCAPLYQERISYLSYLQSIGMSLFSIREYAEIQINIMEVLCMKEPYAISREGINKAWSKWNKLCLERNGAESHIRKRKFFKCAYGWFDYLGILISDSASLPGQDVIETYCNWMIEDKGLAQETIESRKRELIRFLGFLNTCKCQISHITISNVDAYLLDRHNNGWCRRSIAIIASILRGFIQYAYVNKIIEKDFSKSIKGPRVYSHESMPYAPKWSDVEKIASYYKGKDAVSIRNRAIVYLLVLYGLRSNEVADIMLEDIDWSKDCFVIRHIKRGRTQIYPMLPVAGNIIIEYLQNVRNNTCNNRHLFLMLHAPYHKLSRYSIYNIVATAYKRLGIVVKHIGGHSLRHAFASHLINNGETMKSISDILGHRSMNSTKTYAKVDLIGLSTVADMEWEGLL